MHVHRIASTFAGAARGASLALSDDEMFLANLSGPIGGDNAGQRWISGSHSLCWRDATDGLPRIQSRLGGVAVGLAGSSMVGKTAGINGLQTLSVTGGQYLQSSVVLDPQRNTVYGLIKPAAGTTTVRALYGPVTMPVSAPPYDDVLDLAVGADGKLRWMQDTPTTSALIHSDAGDRRGAVTVFRVTMSPTTGKAIWVHGYAEARNTALVASLAHADLQLCRYGSQDSVSRFSGEIADLLILPGVDYSDPMYAAADTRIRAILVARAGL